MAIFNSYVSHYQRVDLDPRNESRKGCSFTNAMWYLRGRFTMAHCWDYARDIDD